MSGRVATRPSLTGSTATSRSRKPRLMPGDARAAMPAGICPASIRARPARTAIRSACSRLVIIEVPSPIQIGGDARGRLPGCRARPLSGRRRLVPHSRRRASALHQGDVLRQHVWSPRWNGLATGHTRCLARGLGAPRVRRAGDGRSPYHPRLLRSSTPARYSGSPTGPASDRRGQTPDPGGRAAVARVLHPSVVIAAAEGVDLIGEEQSLRGRCCKVSGTEEPRSRSSVGTGQPG